MAEYIKREDAYITLTDYYHHSTKIQHMALKEALDRVPAADVRPVRRGKWVHEGSDVWRCSECDYGIMPWNAGVNFCPNCGADCRGDRGGK